MMKVRAYKIIYLIWIVILLLEVDFFHLFSFLSEALIDVNTVYNRTLIAALSLIAFIIAMFYYKKEINDKWFYKYYMALVLFLSVQFIASAFKYDMTLMDYFMEMRFYLVQFLIYPLVVICKKYGLDKFTKSIFVIVGIEAFLIGLQAILSNTSGIWFLEGYTRSYIMLYGKTIRLFASPLVAYMVLFVLAKVITCVKVSIFEAIASIVSLLIILFVHQTRSNIIAILATIIIVILFTKLSKRKAILCLILVVIMAYAINMGVLDEFFATFQKGDIRYTSTVIRMEEISYFLRQFSDNILLGIGCIRDNHTAFMKLKYGSQLNYYYSDIGIIGDLAKFGISGILLDAFLIVGAISSKKNSFLQTEKLSGEKVYFYKTLKFAIIVYLCLSLSMLAYFESERVIMLCVLCTVLYVI